MPAMEAGGAVPIRPPVSRSPRREPTLSAPSARWAPRIAVLFSVACGASGEGAEDWRAQIRDEVDAPAETLPSPGDVHAPLALEGLPSGLNDVHGNEIPIACETCHGLRTLHVPPPLATDEPGGPHVGFTFDHGERPCTACHDPEDLSHLRLADGSSIPVREAMQLCAQCHGPQARDFAHGTHGGMRGHWDTARGPRLRNHCVDCHDPHRPAIPVVEPMPPPRDRFRPASGDHHAMTEVSDGSHAAPNAGSAGDGAAHDPEARP
ncbi:MAG: hypothetical protein OHK0013_28670 [Sandaracinaceae bacterium]